ncbi:MAG: fibrinogen-like YCDxxxxGGGW domain-containing protein [Candidatus Aureabacteria bacterium]|nr:fibrinogen-like YCDxxxxGGGW domain-containing protein [Candidatus Auribacterota bacterium]
MKKMMTLVLGLMCAVGLARLAIGGSLDAPGSPSTGSGMYTLQNLYDYIVSGTALTVQTGFQEPASSPGATMKTTKEIGDAIAGKFSLCNATAYDVALDKTFFCTQPGNWGVQTGKVCIAGTPTPTPTVTPTRTPTATPTSTPIYASCLALKNSGVNTDGLYTIDADGPGGNAPFNAYCDMTTDGGGWTLVVRVVNDSNHSNTNAYGTLTSPSQLESAKLADTTINMISTELYRFNCGNIDTRYYDATGIDFKANGSGSSGCIFHYSQTYHGSWETARYQYAGWRGAASENEGEHEQVYWLDYSTGCYNDPDGTHLSGVLWAR